MADNNEILQELFFKKRYASEMDKLDEKLKKQLPTYDPKRSGSGIEVSDSKEVGKRLQGALGFVIGQNTVASQANKAIKTFNIIVSDDLSPETIVMLKSYLEEKYADTIQLLVSNSIIDLTQFEQDSKDANIALQAVEKLSNVDFNTKQRLARSAMKGELTADEIFKNNSLYQLLRTYKESADYKTGDPILDTLLESSVILPSDKVDDFITLYEKGEYTSPIDIPPSPYYHNEKDLIYKRAGEGGISDDPSKDDTVNARTDRRTALLYRTFANNKNAEAAVNDKNAAAASKTIADLLGRPENKYIRDRYEKALYLLSTGRISGDEFISYSMDRVGIPLDHSVRATLIKKFPVEAIRLYGSDGKALLGDVKPSNGKFKYNQHGGQKEYLAAFDEISNRLLLTAGDTKVNGEVINLYDKISHVKLKEAFALMGGSIAGAAAGGAGIATAVALGASTILAPYIVIPVLAASGISGAVIAHLINKKKQKKLVANTRRVEGRERVEMLIDQLEENIIEVSNKARSVARAKAAFTYANMDVSEEDIKKRLATENNNYDRFKKNLKYVYQEMDTSFVPDIDELEALYESVKDTKVLKPYKLSEKAIMQNYEDLKEAISYPDSIEELQYINEARTIVISNKAPIKINKIKIPKNGEFMPSFSGLSDVKAYGSVEYDRKMIRDRRYNEPLFMTIRFKERYSDGKFGDNELTAVLGILGVVNIVPSSEMETILKANAGLGDEEIAFDSSNSDSKSQIDKIFSQFRNTELGKKLPVSGKLFNNLSKLTSLAVANKLSGKDTSPLANTNIIFSQKEIDNVKVNYDIDYIKDMKLVSKLMKKYFVSDLVICNDVNERAYMCDNFEKVSFDLVPYSALRSKSTADQNLSTLSSLSRMMIK